MGGASLHLQSLLELEQGLEPTGSEQKQCRSPDWTDTAERFPAILTPAHFSQHLLSELVYDASSSLVL